MIECTKCGEKFKTKQGLKGHTQFKHSDFVKVRARKKKVERILIGDKVVKINELAIDLDSAVRLKKLAIELKMSIEKVIDHLISLEEQTKDFEYTDCIKCGEYFWMPKEGAFTGSVYCVWCAKGQVWSNS